MRPCEVCESTGVDGDGYCERCHVYRGTPPQVDEPADVPNVRPRSRRNILDGELHRPPSTHEHHGRGTPTVQAVAVR